jgi:hypothetical protein
VVPDGTMHGFAAVGLVHVDAAHGLYAQDSEHEEHDRQHAREPTPRSGEQRAGGMLQVHSEPKSNGTDTVLGNTQSQCEP